MDHLRIEAIYRAPFFSYNEMMEISPDNPGTLDRAVALLLSVARDGADRPIADHAAALDIPLSSAYRTVALLARHGLLAQAKRGHFGPGLALASLAAATDPHAIIASAARAPLRRLARTMRATAHLGVLEGDMVTYVVKEQGGGRALFTREDGQLEAYCSAVGKVLLAAFEAERLAEYLAAGPFVALTGRTITDPPAIAAEIAKVGAQGHAIDDREIADDLFCIAAPVRGPDGGVVAAISLSRPAHPTDGLAPLADVLACAAAIGRRLGHFS